MDKNHQRKLRSGLKARMKRVAQSRQCPSCERKQALSKIPKIYPTEPQIYVCRYCGHEFTRTP